MLMIYTLIFLLLLTSIAAGRVLLYIITVTTANTAFLNAWHMARETEEEIAPTVRL